MQAIRLSSTTCSMTNSIVVRGQETFKLEGRSSGSCHGQMLHQPHHLTPTISQFSRECLCGLGSHLTLSHTGYSRARSTYSIPSTEKTSANREYPRPSSFAKLKGKLRDLEPQGWEIKQYIDGYTGGKREV
ncbi:hypothetical protein CALVIDRAFT_140119 [Calocera viscosa TUFC12733]|uniref:Uncharacterized protein n=1 Tax=Calocera viscosa (strain TUFC12733) TaxID=1330018 RepID=A0A167M236_CALVF|nr:hypothetical protein CALVIDRAFT_140119 [Calocera viscosa TUFC12733]